MLAHLESPVKSLLPLVLLLAACPTVEKPDDGLDSEGPHCEDTSTAITFDEVTALGFSAADVLLSVPTAQTTEFAYVDDRSAVLDLGFTPGPTAWFVASEAVYPDSGEESPAIGVECEDRVEIDGTFTFTTDDGAFAESFASTVAATGSAVTLRQELDLDALAGTFDLAFYVQSSDWDELAAWIDVVFVGGASSGAVSGQASGEDECEDGEECTAWAEMVEVGSWSADLVEE